MHRQRGEVAGVWHQPACCPLQKTLQGSGGGVVMPLSTSESSQGTRPYCIHAQSAKCEEAGENKVLEQGSLTWFPTPDQ